MLIRQFDSPDEFRAYFNRTSVFNTELTNAVREILEQVRKEGDSAVQKYTAKFDYVELDTPRVDLEKVEMANNFGGELLKNFTKAAENILKFHQREMQDQKSWMLKNAGAEVGQKVVPLQRVGVYVPGGTAAYPSSVLMNVIPAQVAGVQEIVIASPPDKSTGTVNAMVLAVAEFLGIDEIYAMGGAQAVAALAFGTETIQPVDKITGPGNQYVNEAKRQVFGQVGIDSLAGPSEILVIADESANPTLLAADLLSQAEHDVQARSILVTTSAEIADRTITELDKQLMQLERKSITAKSLSEQGAIVKTDSLQEAVALANDIAPEHLELLVENPDEHLNDVRNAGAVFLGSWTPEPVGDYWAGSNHILPTAGAARYASALSVRDFLRYISVIKYDQISLITVGRRVMQMAQLEGLDAHAAAIEKRLSGQEGER